MVCEGAETGLPSEEAPLSFRPNRFQAGTEDMMGRGRRGEVEGRGRSCKQRGRESVVGGRLVADWQQSQNSLVLLLRPVAAEHKIRKDQKPATHATSSCIKCQKWEF